MAVNTVVGRVTEEEEGKGGVGKGGERKGRREVRVGKGREEIEEREGQE